MFGDRFFQLLFTNCFWGAFVLSSVSAQIIPDSSLDSESSIVVEDTIVKETVADLIQGGAVRGENLFHSFSEFGIDPNQQVYFANPEGISNILTRVTGGNISEIWGTLGVNGAANLFLLNPNGIVFGENATLDINGSFLGTTATSYLFENAYSYDAANPDVPPLLTVNIPLGLQFGSDIGDIEVRGTGNELSLNSANLTPNTSLRPSGLEVSAGNTFALLGGELKFNGANITASAARIELGSVAESGTVQLEANSNLWEFGYQGINNFDDINLMQASSLDISGSQSGSLQVQGQNITLQDNSAIIGNTSGSENGGEINLQATDLLNIMGNEDTPFPSAIFSQVESGATGKGSNLNLQAASININNNAFIISSTEGGGNGGTINLNAQNINLTNRTSGFFGTGIFSRVVSGGSGTGGDIALTAENVSLESGSQINLETNGVGNGGNLNLTATQLQILGRSESFNIPSAINATVGSGTIGRGGSLNLTTANKLSLRDGGQIISRTGGEGNGGDITIQARNSQANSQVEIIGTSNLGFPSIINTSVSRLDASGDGGNLTIDGDSLSIQDGGRISSETRGAGKGGSLTFNVEGIQVVGVSSTPGFSSLSSSILTSVTQPDTPGEVGDLTINTDNLLLQDGGNISSINGSFVSINNEPKQSVERDPLLINSKNTKIIGFSDANDEPSGLFTNTIGNQNGANLTIAGQQLTILNGGSTGTSTSGSGNAGNLTIVADELVTISGVKTFTNSEGEAQLSSSSLFAQVDNDAVGNGGLLKVETANLQVDQGGQISANTFGQGNAGSIDLIAQDIEIRDSIEIDIDDRVRSGISSGVEKLGSGNGGNITIKADNLRVLEGGAIGVDATTKSIPTDERGITAGNINISAENIEVSGTLTEEIIQEFNQPQVLPSRISAFSEGESNSGQIVINAEVLQILDNADISVRNINSGNAGNIEINASRLSIESGGRLSAEVNAGNQGNVELNTDNIFIKQGEINTEATGSATSGNIAIDNSENIVLRDTEIIADATVGDAGNIQITTQGLFASTDVVIRANSKLGIDGQLDIQTLSFGRNVGLSLLPTEPLNPDLKSNQSCETDTTENNNYFGYIGRGGLPETPLDNVVEYSYLADWGTIETDTVPKVGFNSHPSSNFSFDSNFNDVPREAQTWKLNQKGKVELIASETSQPILSDRHYQCQRAN